jgi:hypothetical protein
LEWLSIVSSERLTLITMVASSSGMYHMSVLNPEIVPPWPQSLPNFAIPSPYPEDLGTPSARCVSRR